MPCEQGGTMRVTLELTGSEAAALAALTAGIAERPVGTGTAVKSASPELVSGRRAGKGGRNLKFP
jgi:hypothetical protein